MVTRDVLNYSDRPNIYYERFGSVINQDFVPAEANLEPNQLEHYQKAQYCLEQCGLLNEQNGDELRAVLRLGYGKACRSGFPHAIGVKGFICHEIRCNDLAAEDDMIPRTPGVADSGSSHDTLKVLRLFVSVCKYSELEECNLDSCLPYAIAPGPYNKISRAFGRELSGVESIRTGREVPEARAWQEGFRELISSSVQRRECMFGALQKFAVLEYIVEHMEKHLQPTQLAERSRHNNGAGSSREALAPRPSMLDSRVGAGAPASSARQA